MSSFLSEAFKGAKADIDSAGNELLPRLGRAIRVARILLMELAAIAALAPYGAYAMSVYRRLPSLAQSLEQTQQTASPGVAQSSSAATSRALNPRAAPVPAATAVAELATALGQLPEGRDGVAVHRQVPYGPAPRNLLDVYVPIPPPESLPEVAASGPHYEQRQEQQQQRQRGALPVVFFVHGGVWASGETWQYAPMATRLAQAGLVVVVPTYTLYPEALAGTMVEEVSAALSWTLDNVGRYGGDQARITAAGHSAGGHLLLWALLRRAAAAEAAAAVAAAGADGANGTASTNGTAPTIGTVPSPPQPQRAVQQSAAPSQPPHMQHSAHRHDSNDHNSHDQRANHHNHHGHHHQSDPASQGYAAHGGDARETGAYLLGGGGTSVAGAVHALRAVADAQLHPSFDDGDGAAAARAAAAAAPAHGEADGRMPAAFVGMSAVYDIAKHYEFEQSRAVHELSMMKRAMGGFAGFAAASPTVILAAAADAAAADAPPSAAAPPPLQFYTSFELAGDAVPARVGLAHSAATGGGAMGADGVMTGRLEPAFSLAAARRLPPCVVAGSGADHMVPWHEAVELVAQLRRCGVPVRPLLYNHVGHGDFVMSWRPFDMRQLWRRRQQRQEQREQQRYAQVPSGPALWQGTSARDPEAGLGRTAGRVGSEEEEEEEDVFEGLLPCAADFLRIATGRVRPVPSGAPVGLPGGDSGGGAAGPAAAGASEESLVTVRSKI